MNLDCGYKHFRMRSCLERFRATATDTGSGISMSQAKEQAEDFFVQCYHLKDWIKTDYPHLEKAVEGFITGSPNLSLAADICNTFKHKKRGARYKSRSGEDLVEFLQHTKMAITPSGFVCSAQMEIKTASGKSFNAFDVAEGCVQDWERFFAVNNISF